MRQLNGQQRIVDGDDTPSQYFREFMNEFRAEVARYVPIFGDGIPEGVVEAPLYTLYIDTSGGTGGIEYRKMQSEIGGDRSQGWVAVA